jgi:type I restriction enzyme S subunit
MNCKIGAAKSNYKKLGDFIRIVNKKNTGLISVDLRGLSMTKEFRKSTSNIVGTDLTNYKLVYRDQFACDFMSVIRVHKLPVVLHNEDSPVIVSPAYVVFEIKDQRQLSPEYLMMWFRRSEFDRYADFRCDSAIRGGFKCEELCEVELPIPSIEKQHEIVREYNTIVNRISLNEQLIQKLEETAQSIYKRWFVEFEFPNEEGQPYKSSDGIMVWNAELEKEIPEEWDSGKLDKYVKLSQGLVINATTRHLVVEKGLPLLKITDLFNETASMFIDEEKVAKKNIAKKEDLIYTRTGQVGYIFRNKEGVVYNNCFKIIPIQNQLSKEFIFWYFKDENVRHVMVELASGSAQSDLAHTAFFSVSIIKPPKRVLDLFDSYSEKIVNQIFILEESNKTLFQVKDLILAKMTKVEDTREKEITY